MLLKSNKVWKWLKHAGDRLSMISDDLFVIVFVVTEEVVLEISIGGSWELVEEVTGESSITPVVHVFLVGHHLWWGWEEVSFVLDEIDEWVLEDLHVLGGPVLVGEGISVSWTDDCEGESFSWSGPCDGLDVWGNVDWFELHVQAHGVVFTEHRLDWLSTVWVKVDSVCLGSLHWVTLDIFALVKSTVTGIEFGEVRDLKPFVVDEVSLVGHVTHGGWETGGPEVEHTTSGVTEEGGEDENLVHLFEKFVIPNLLLLKIYNKYKFKDKFLKIYI